MPLCALVPPDVPVTLAVKLGATDVAAEQVTLQVAEQTVEGSSGPVARAMNPGGIADFALNLSTSGVVGQRDHVLSWEVVRAGGVVQSLESTVLRAFHSLGPAVGIVNAQYRAAERATDYARGAQSPAEAASALRHGIRGKDGIAYDPNAPRPAFVLNLYDKGVGNCVHFSDLLALLARTIGIPAKHVVLRGGFMNGRESRVSVLFGQLLTGKASSGAQGSEGSKTTRPYTGPTAVEIDAGVSLVDVKAGRPEYEPGPPGRALLGSILQGRYSALDLSPTQSWAFSFHCIVEMAGARHDAALDVEGFAGRAYLQGRHVEFLEPVAKDFGVRDVDANGSFLVPRKAHPVELLEKTADAHGEQLAPDELIVHGEVIAPFDLQQRVFAAPVSILVDAGSTAEVVSGDRLTLAPSLGEARLTCQFQEGELLGPEFKITLRRK